MDGLPRAPGEIPAEDAEPTASLMDLWRAQRTTPPASRARTSTAITARSALLCCHRRDGETDEAINARYVLYLLYVVYVLYSSYPYSVVR